MWRELVEWKRRHMQVGERPLADATDLAIPRSVETVEEALQILRADRRARDREPGPETDATFRRPDPS